MKKYHSFRIGDDKISYLLDKKAVGVMGLLTISTFVILILCVAMGTEYIPFLDVLQVLLGQDSTSTFIIKELRLPRILVALLIGCALAVSGAILQSVVRNPLAAPDTLGITGGAAVAAVSLITFFSDGMNGFSISEQWIPVAAFVGATVVAALIYLFSWKDGVSPFRFILIGIGFFTLTQAVTNLIMLLGPVWRASQSQIWLTGTIYGSKWEHVYILSLWLVILLLLTFLLGRKIGVQEFGDSVAIGLGSKVQRERFILLLISTALAGVAVAFAGAVSFVGLIAPNAARRLVGGSFGPFVFTSACLGAMFVLLADLLGRTLVANVEIPAGVFTALIGAPYFIYLLYRSR
ncbi:iron ABC transporter permease [Hazenella sp. IB182357]|uniref:Iron ABC transporter permease n=1 Tax=Polycladospora coralii TaxID=2771432 RepID=A0A926RT45_9BACL|nr:iron ABC transporter permease [Polycladospora coralii]MBS7529801.1 iron ABC transporter permease [Polycladospora coralii]